MDPLLNELTLCNFKPFGATPQKAPMSHITLIYGPNSGGKSSVIQTLLLLKQSSSISDQALSSSVNPRGEFIDLAGYRSMVHKHDTQREISIGLDLSTRYYPFADSANIMMTFTEDRDLPVLNKVRYQMTRGEHQVLDIRLVNAQPQVVLEGDSRIPQPATFTWEAEHADASIRSYILFASTNLIRHEGLINVSDDDIVGGQPRREIEDILPTENLLENLRTATFEAGYYPFFLPVHLSIEGSNNFVTVRMTDGSKESVEFAPHNFRLSLMEIAQQFVIMNHEISYLGSLLNEPRRYYVGAIGDYFSVGARGEHTVDMLAGNPALQADVNYWFRKFKIPYTLGLIRDVGFEDLAGSGAINIITVVDGRTETSLTLSDVGFGISQILPVIVEGLAGRSDIICVDQPEVHLHPRLQAEIAELMIATRDHDHRACKIHRHDCCSDESECRAIAKQWIVETHSELLVRRVQSRIAEGHLTPEEVSILYVEPSENGSRIIKLEMDERGEFVDDWPAGFFDESTAEVLRVLRSQRNGS